MSVAEFEYETDPAVIQPARIAKRLKAMAKAAKTKLPSRGEFVEAVLEIAADAMLAKRTYETEDGVRTYDAPERQHALRGCELAATIALDPKARPDELPVEGSPDDARSKLREMGFEIVKVSGPQVGSA